MRNAMEELYSSCRKGKVSEIEKLDKKFIKAKDELNAVTNNTEEQHGKEKR